MIKLLAETPGDQEMIDMFRRAYENLEKFVEKQHRRIRELEEEFNEYKKRHPSTVGVKNSETYAIKEDKAGEPQVGFQPVQMPESKPVRKRGAQQGHRGITDQSRQSNIGEIFSIRIVRRQEFLHSCFRIVSYGHVHRHSIGEPCPDVTV